MKKTGRWKKYLVIPVLLMILAGLSGVAENRSFTDVSDQAWFIDDLGYILDDSRKIIAGYPDGTFRPGETLTADMFIKLIVTAMGHEVENGKEYWASTYIEKAIEEGYVIPEEDDLFVVKTKEDPYWGYKRPITRGDMAVVISRVLDKVLYEYEFRDPLTICTLIKDYNTISHYQKSSIIKCYDSGIITGYVDGEFKAKNILTRAEAVAIIRRIIDPTARKMAVLSDLPNPSPTPIPFSELNRPGKKDLGNGVVEVEGVHFDPETDAAPNGAMRILKAEEFVHVALEYLKFYEKDGKARVRGYIPELPEGYEWDMVISCDIDGPDDRGLSGISLFTKGGFSPEQNLPKSCETFDRSLYTDTYRILDLILVIDIRENKRSVSGGRIIISFSEKEYKKYDAIGGHTNKEEFDPRGFIEW